jgi:hypothetical protein
VIVLAHHDASLNYQVQEDDNNGNIEKDNQTHYNNSQNRMRRSCVKVHQQDVHSYKASGKKQKHSGLHSKWSK